MLLYSLPAYVNPFPKTFIIKGNDNPNGNANARDALMAPFQVLTFVNEEATCCINSEARYAINEAVISAIMAGKNRSPCFFISCFTVSLAPSINRPEFSSDSTILIISSISLFEII